MDGGVFKEGGLGWEEVALEVRGEGLMKRN